MGESWLGSLLASFTPSGKVYYQKMGAGTIREALCGSRPVTTRPTQPSTTGLDSSTFFFFKFSLLSPRTNERNRGQQQRVGNYQDKAKHMVRSGGRKNKILLPPLHKPKAPKGVKMSSPSKTRKWIGPPAGVKGGNANLFRMRYTNQKKKKFKYSGC